MKGIENLISYINSKSDAQCAEIARLAAEDCSRIRAKYSRTEQDEYWKYIDHGSKEAEHRLEQLNALAGQEAGKQIHATQQEMAGKAFRLAAQKLQDIPEDEFAALVKRLKLDPKSNADEVVDKFRNILSPVVMSVLFE
jgi:vacuolar-type H+-ATPase subunit E/Vma4